MEHTVAVNKKVITIRICIYAVCIVSWFIVVLLTGLHTGFHIFFITAFFAFRIYRNIRRIRKYNDCITSEESAVKIRPVSDEVIFTVLTPLAAVFIFFFTIIFTLQIPTINSFSPSQYKFSKLYIEKAGGTKTDLLPDKLPETLTITIVPSASSGTGEIPYRRYSPRARETLAESVKLRCRQ